MTFTPDTKGPCPHIPRHALFDAATKKKEGDWEDLMDHLDTCKG